MAEPKVIVRPPFLPAELAAVRLLLREYAALPEVGLATDHVLAEVADWPGPFLPPGGIWVAASGREFAGCVGLRPNGPEAGELGRLYVRPGWRGRGVGRLLAERALAAAREAGYRRVVLDTVPPLEASIRLYRSLGFVPVEPWPGAASGAICMALELG